MSNPEGAASLIACRHCGRRQATRRDYLRRRNGLKSPNVCWAEAREVDAWLKPEEENADLAELRRKLAHARRLVHVLLCDAMAAEGKRRDWRIERP